MPAMPHRDRPFSLGLMTPLLTALALMLAGCATVAAAPTAASGAAVASTGAAPARAASAPAAGASAPAAGTTPGQPPAFANVIRDAKKSDGLIGFWQKDEKVWLELKPEDFGKPFLLSPKIARGIGEAFVLGGTIVGPASLVELRRVNNLVQLVALNRRYTAEAGTPEARGVAAGFSDSLLASAPVASQAHPEHKTVLVEAGPLFLGDLLGLATHLQRTYRQGYALDGRHTHFTSVRGMPDQVVFNVQAHFATGSIAQATPGSPPGAPVPTTPSSLPDARSMLLGLYYSLAALPAQAMVPRKADSRVGYFTTSVDNFSNDAAYTPRQQYVRRWRLEKKDPAAELSEPVKPIVFWIDRSVPLKYRDSVMRGIVEWNKAFEKIGFKDAIVAKVQPDDASFDTLDVGVASVRWINSAEPSFDGYGPSVTDPRSGEILDADVVIDGNAARIMRSLRSQVLGSTLAQPSASQSSGNLDFPALMQIGSPDRLAALLGHRHAAVEVCEYGLHAGEQFGYALDVLAARGEFEVGPDSPQAEAFAQERVMAVTVHEIGHALGLRHNFRSSRAYTLAQLSDPAFTAANGTSASVMDYPDLNLPRPGVPLAQHGAVFRSAIGPYDYWAIEYAYKPIAAADEAAELARVAARSAEPLLAYGTDEDNALGIDPESLQFDLGDDPVAYALSRFAIARDLLARQERRQLTSDQNYALLRRSVRFAVRDVAVSTGVLVRQIGGVRTLRDRPGSGRDPLQPVPAAVQRAALDALARHVLATDSFRLSPALQRRLATDFDDGPGTDFSIVDMVLGLQRTLLGQLMSDALAARILDSEGKFDVAAGPGQAGAAFRLSELYERLRREVWSELAGSADIAAPRRELQREHLNRLAASLVRPSGGVRADVKGLQREQARELLVRIGAAQRRGGLSAETRAHLAESSETLAQALAARLQRAGI
jgi:hypothetical protein